MFSSVEMRKLPYRYLSMAVVDNRYLIIMRDCSIQKVSLVTHLIASKGRPFDSEGDRGGTH